MRCAKLTIKTEKKINQVFATFFQWASFLNLWMSCLFLFLSIRSSFLFHFKGKLNLNELKCLQSKWVNTQKCKTNSRLIMEFRFA